MSVKRKKDPKNVRLALLKAAISLAQKDGIDAITLSETSEIAGVTKGALFHHFQNKENLLYSMFEYLLTKLDEDIQNQLSQVPLGYGRFTRAYINVVLSSVETDKQIWSALINLMNDNKLNSHWSKWYKNQIIINSNTDSDLRLEIIRQAVCGICLGIAKGDYSQEMVQILKDKMIEMIATKK